MAFFEWLGIDETAPEFIVAHEYGHHLQYSLTNGPVVDERTPERTRYLEMEADALAAYYMHHPRGASRQNWKIMQAIEAAAAGGDCRFTSNGHHGTPAQRLDSAEFAIQVIDGSKGKGHKSSVAEFRDLFHTVFDHLVAANVN
jgi:predicted metalloprotease